MSSSQVAKNSRGRVVIAGGTGFLGAPLLLRTDPDLAILGRYCASRRLADENFEFEFPEVAGALRDLLQKN